MKWYNYIIARTFLKLTDEAEKRRRKEEVRGIKDTEVKLDKGYWKYDLTQEEYLFAEPKKNEHFVTIEINGDTKTCNLILSKKPLTLESDKYEYPWEAEQFCIRSGEIYRERGYKVTVRREAPILIADSDICCPYCFNSGPLKNWIENSYKQELLEPPENHKQLSTGIIKDEKINIDDIKTEKVWCPICNNGIDDKKLLIVKGDEWKAGIIKDTLLPKYTSPFSEKVIKEHEASDLEKLEETHRSNVGSVVDEDRKVVTDPVGIVTDSSYGGLVVKVVEKITRKKGNLLKTKWIQIKNNIPSNCEFTKAISTSYAFTVDLKSMPKWISKGDKNSYPIIYVPLSELVISNYHKEYDNKILQEEIGKFHAGESLDFIEIGSDMQVLDNYVLVQLAYELGLTHVPAMVFGGDERKINLEKQYKDGVLIEKQMEGNMVKALGTFIKKGENIFRTEAYIQWGNSNSILGSVLMLNPGSAKLQFPSLTSNSPISGEIIIDPTMEALIKLVEELHEKAEGFEGRLYIYNLFPLQNPRSSDAVKNFEVLWGENEQLVKSFPKKRDILLDRFKKSPWILIGWGCGKGSDNLNFVRNEWLSLIKESCTPIVGKMGKDKLDFYHPKPHLQSQQIEYREDIKAQYNEIFKCETTKIVEQVNTIADSSWKRHMRDYRPVEEFIIGRYKLSLYDIHEKEYIINYRYRLLCFIKESNEPVLALNHEWTQLGTCCLGASVADGHINLGNASPDTSLLEFRKWALQNVSSYIKDIDSKLLYEKIKKYEPIIYSKEENKETDEINELMEKRIKSIVNKIREFEDTYEYCFVMDYEEKYLDFEVHAVPLTNVQVVLLEIEEKFELASIEFSKSNFNIEQVITWVQCEDIYFGDRKKGNHMIDRCSRILEGIKFKGNVIAVYEKGNKSVTADINNFDEITEKYNVQFDKIDTTKSKKLQKGLSLILNGELVNEIPRIDFKRNKDMLISNGNLITADYIDEYSGGIGIYRYDDESVPIVSFIDTNTTVYIDLYEKVDGAQVCVIEYKYIIDIEVL